MNDEAVSLPPYTPPPGYAIPPLYAYAMWAIVAAAAAASGAHLGARWGDARIGAAVGGGAAALACATHMFGVWGPPVALVTAPPARGSDALPVGGLNNGPPAVEVPAGGVNIAGAKIAGRGPDGGVTAVGNAPIAQRT